MISQPTITGDVTLAGHGGVDSVEIRLRQYSGTSFTQYDNTDNGNFSFNNIPSTNTPYRIKVTEWVTEHCGVEGN